MPDKENDSSQTQPKDATTESKPKRTVVRATIAQKETLMAAFRDASGNKPMNIERAGALAAETGLEPSWIRSWWARMKTQHRKTIVKPEPDDEAAAALLKNPAPNPSPPRDRAKRAPPAGIAAPVSKRARRDTSPLPPSSSIPTSPVPFQPQSSSFSVPQPPIASSAPPTRQPTPSSTQPDHSFTGIQSAAPLNTTSQVSNMPVYMSRNSLSSNYPRPTQSAAQHLMRRSNQIERPQSRVSQGVPQSVLQYYAPPHNTSTFHDRRVSAQTSFLNVPLVYDHRVILPPTYTNDCKGFVQTSPSLEDPANASLAVDLYSTANLQRTTLKELNRHFRTNITGDEMAARLRSIDRTTLDTFAAAMATVFLRDWA
ncbi:hypothetical protein MKEN_01050400 [Mycena kentingensis (nom. inval.)]|nr:hypothetical protein MKEN_01050400 [Mycena kentingensis (nom. inval.)]